MSSVYVLMKLATYIWFYKDYRGLIWYKIIFIQQLYALYKKIISKFVMLKHFTETERMYDVRSLYALLPYKGVYF